MSVQVGLHKFEWRALQENRFSHKHSCLLVTTSQKPLTNRSRSRRPDSAVDRPVTVSRVTVTVTVSTLPGGVIKA